MQIGRKSVYVIFLMAIFQPSPSGASGNVMCDEAGLKSLIDLTRKYTLQSASYRIPPGAWKQGDLEACAIVRFTVDEMGKAKDAHVVDYAPWPAAGRAAILVLESYRFNAPSGSHLTMSFRTPRFGDASADAANAAMPDKPKTADPLPALH
jgi:hypothetical protein